MSQLKNSLPSILVVGIYLLDQSNCIVKLVDRFSQSKHWNIAQRWVAQGTKQIPVQVQRVTVGKSDTVRPKFEIINELLARESLDSYEYVIFCDDDILLQPQSIDQYIDLVKKYDFALAQPARSHNSFNDHDITWKVPKLQARRTRFVEIGPIFSVRKDIYKVFFPFDLTSPMGWGYDFVWPTIIEQYGLRMGIIDATPVDHSLREPTSGYSRDKTEKEMQRYLAKHPYLSSEEAFSIIESYPN